MRRLFFISILSLLCCVPGFSDELSLAELIDVALKNNPETQKAWAGVKRAQAALGVTRSPDYPQLDAQGSVSHAREVKFPNGPDTVFSSYGGELNLNYLVCDFGETRAAVRSAKQGLSAAKWWADFSMQKVIAEVSEYYYELLNARDLLESKESSLEDAKKILAAATELRDAGLRSENDCLIAKASVSEILLGLAQQKAAAEIAYGKLLTSLGVPIDSTIEVETKPEAVENPLFQEGIATLLSAAQEQRADLMAKQAMLEGMNAQVTRAKRAPLPKLRGIGQGGWFEYSKHQGNGYNYSVGLGLEVPLFKGFFYTYQKKEALANAEISAAELKELQNAVSLEVLTYSETVKAASEAIGYSEDFFSDALQAYNRSLEGYHAGIINVFDLLQTQRYLSDARNKKVQAKTAWLVSLSQLAFAIGSANS
jgi:outer membrane protein